jgi:tRNA(fMet)-specific endonuclease VapC
MEMRRLLLDTSAYSLFRRGHEKIYQELEWADHVFLNPIVIGELLAGFDRGRYKEKNRQELRTFIAETSVSVPPITDETSERYSLIYKDLKEQGKPIPTNDLWISAHAMELGTALMTADSDFLHVKQIQTIFIS